MDQRIEAILKKAADEIYSIGVKDGAEKARITLIAQLSAPVKTVGAPRGPRRKREAANVEAAASIDAKRRVSRRVSVTRKPAFSC